MTGKHLLELYEALPFRQFDFLLADGSRVRIGHSECIEISETGRIIKVIREDDSYIFVDLLLVLAIEVAPPLGARAES